MIIRHKYYFIIVFLWMLIALSAMFLMEKGQLVIFLNGLHSPIPDAIFKWGTELGHGLIFVLLILFLAGINRSRALMGILAYALSGAISQLGKKVLFKDMPRPKSYFAEHGIDLHFVDGVDVHSWHSFPSGHTATAFAMFTLIALLSKKVSVQIIAAFLAVFVAISRVYLAQHFLEDVFAGSIIGLCTTILVFYLVENKFKANDQMQKPLYRNPLFI